VKAYRIRQNRRLLVKPIRVLVGIMLLISVCSVSAQSKNPGPTTPDWRLDSSYGSIDLDAGFWPDPELTSVRAGGSVSLSSLGYSGYVAEAPDLDLYYDAGTSPLFIYVAEQDSDTVLLVNDPNGNWHYNDDGAGGTRPGIRFSNPESGMYNVWIGTYGSEMIDAVVAISEASWDGVSSSGAIPDWSLDSSYGSLNLSAGFSPDPNLTSVLAGGSVDLDSLGYWGSVAEAPDMDLYYDAGSYNLYIYVTEQNADTVLLVNAPDGEWHYSDDTIGTRPGIRFTDPASGMYNIWVGTYGDDMVSAEIAISEIMWDDESSSSVQNGLSPDFSLDPAYGSVELTAGFKVPYEVTVIGGGPVSLETLGHFGRVAEAPDFSLRFQSAGRPLYIWVNRDDGDSVLLINSPGGTWLYNDDADGLGFGSGIVINNPDSGRYDIWVGTYGDDYLDATLVISEFHW
jgi:hypothetical protein